jgi:hypothetical protein
MERLKISPEDAFDALRRSSNLLNEKLHAVALSLAETGEFDTTNTRQTDGRSQAVPHVPPQS